MARKKKITDEATEVKRLLSLYEGLPPKKYSLAQGLIVQAARLRVRLDVLWADIEENGEFEYFTQSKTTEPYQKERPASKTFTATDKNYQGIIRQLNDMLPKEEEPKEVNELDAFLAE